MAYCKIHLYAALLDSDLPEDPYLAPRPRALLPAAAARALRATRCATTGCVARSSPRSSPTSWSIAPARRSRSGSGRRPAPPRRCSRARYAVAREVFEMRVVLERGRGARQRVDAERPARDADRRAAPGRARDALARAREPAGDRHRGAGRALRARRAMLLAALPGRARRATTRGVRARSVDELTGAGVPAELAARVAAMPSLLSGVRHRRGRRAHRARARDA